MFKKKWQKYVPVILLVGLMAGSEAQAGGAGISAKEFVERYNSAVEKYNSVANSEGYAALNLIDEEMIKEDELCPDGTMKMCLNRDSIEKGTLGHLEVWTDEADELGNSRITLGIALAVYAFDPSMQEVTEATQLYVNLLTGEDPGENSAVYTLEKSEKTVRLNGVYNGYVPVTPSPVPETPEPSKEASVSDKAASDKAGADKSKADKSSAEIAGSDKSASETEGVEKSAAETAGKEKIEADKKETEKPETKKPET